MSHKRKNLLDELNKLAPSEAEKLINQYAKSKNKSVPKSLVITYAHDIEKHLDTVTVSCPYCQSTNIIKKAQNRSPKKDKLGPRVMFPLRAKPSERAGRQARKIC